MSDIVKKNRPTCNHFAQWLSSRARRRAGRAPIRRAARARMSVVSADRALTTISAVCEGARAPGDGRQPVLHHVRSAATAGRALHRVRTGHRRDGDCRAAAAVGRRPARAGVGRRAVGRTKKRGRKPSRPTQNGLGCYRFLAAAFFLPPLAAFLAMRIPPFVRMDVRAGHPRQRR